MRLKNIKHIHFTGIKGVGLTSLALCALDLKINISGSDVDEEFVTDTTLKQRKVRWHVGFSPKYVLSAFHSTPHAQCLVVYTAAHNGPENPEVKAAKEAGILCLSHAEAVGLFMEGKIGISLCGVGGKTTTAAMVATILHEARLKPSFAVGVGNIFNLDTPGRYQKQGKFFVAEADEYFASPGVDDTPKFLYQNPEIIGVTNIAYDHPDVYPNFEATQAAFLTFFKKLPPGGTLVANSDNPATLKVARESGRPLTTYGFHPGADFLIEQYHATQEKSLFKIEHRGITQEYALHVPGRFNALNAAAAVAIATHLGIDQRTASEALRTFRGVSRRFEILKKGNVTIIDDYAHHPEEIKATLAAARGWFPGKRLVAIFQPHTFSRTKALFEEFSRSFGDAHEVILLPIYASAREKEDTSVSSKLLADKVATLHPQASYRESKDDLLQYLKSVVKPGDVILTLGAGDVFLLARRLSRLFT